MENITDSAKSVDIEDNIRSSKSNQWVASRLSSDLHFEEDGVTMDSPLLVFQRFNCVISKNLVRTEVEDKYFYRPELFAKYLYGSTDLWWLVMISSGITRHQEFNRRNIKVFDPKRLEIIDGIIKTTKQEQDTVTEIKDLTLFPIKI